MSKLLPSAEAQGNVVRQAWDRLSRLPGGKRLFSVLVGQMAPYTGSMGATVLALDHGHAQVQLRDRRAVRNHLRCIHAIALCNLAELTGNVAVAYSLDPDARFIVAGLSMEYLKKARGNITGVCDIDVPAGSAKREIEVPVDLLDDEGDVVARSVLRTLIGPKKKS